MSIQPKLKKSPKEAIFNVLRQISYTKLFKKYSSGDFSFNKICINNLVFNENSLVVARFKDFLIYDDNTEFIRRFYADKDCKQRLTKILNFYEKYSKIFPNYLVLKENKYLYRNIRKKQKMIDAFNEIKKEEKENRKKLKNNKDSKGKNDLNELFTKKIKNEIKAFQNNISFKKFKNSFDSDKNNDDTLLINQSSISIYYKKLSEEGKNIDFGKDISDDFEEKNIDSFITNQTNRSITNILNVLNDDKIYTKDLPNILEQNSKTTKEDKNKANIIKKGKPQNNNNNKNKNTQKKKGKEKEINQKPIKIINDTSNKTENDNISVKNIKNNSEIEKKKTNDKNNLYKYAITSTNATNSSSIISKRVKNQHTSSSVNKNSNDNNENKNINIQKNKNINTNVNNNIIITKVNFVNSNQNLYQKTSPNLGKFGLKKHFYKTNNNFKKNTLNKSNSKKIRENEKKNVDNKNNKKEKYTINKEIVKKKYIKSKHISQDFDSNFVCQMTENILNNKNNNIINTNNSSKNIINTEKNMHYKNFITNNNPNLITGDTKPNERNERNFMEDKVLVNVRDIIKQEQDKINEIKNKKLFQTAQKSKNSKESLLKLTKTKGNMHGSVKTLNFYKNKTKKGYLNTIDHNLKNKKNLDIKNEDEKSNNIRNTSAFTKQKTEYNILNKKLMTKQQKTKTKAIFTKNKPKNMPNKNILIKSSENFNKTKNIYKKNENNDNKANIDNKENENQIKDKSKELNTNKSNKLYEIKYESTLFSPTYTNKNKTERKMSSNLSDDNMQKIADNLTSNRKGRQTFRTKNNITKNNYLMRLNNSAKFTRGAPHKNYKSFLIKNKIKLKKEFNNHSSEKNLLSTNILDRIKEVKQNKNDFYTTLKVKNSTKSYNTNNNTKSNKIIKTPILKSRKTNIFKNRINKKLKNDKSGNKTKEELNHNYMSSFSIKVNKTINNNKDKGKEKIYKNKNLKKTWTKNMKKVVKDINNDMKNEFKK